ncbi:MAG: histidinol phosphate phosphatase domain-containing protein [Candidatus Methanomethylophilaceae archaeon]
MRIDLHTHSIFSDGELIPSELVRRAMICGHDAIAITDHVDMTNVEFVVKNLIKATDLCEDYIRVIPGVEVTHVPPAKMDAVIETARRLGAEIIVVHGETVTEPVMKGTNMKAVRNPEVDILAHPGFITEEEAQTAVDNNVVLEITGRMGHNITNGHVANIARTVSARMVVDSDAHAPDNLMSEETAYTVALGAGLTKAEADRAIRITPYDIVRDL